MVWREERVRSPTSKFQNFKFPSGRLNVAPATTLGYTALASRPEDLKAGNQKEDQTYGRQVL